MVSNLLYDVEGTDKNHEIDLKLASISLNNGKCVYNRLASVF